METENVTLKPIPPQIINCSACKKNICIYIKIEW